MREFTFSNGQTLEQFQAILQDAQRINPLDREDAWYIVTHPVEFGAETLATAEQTYNREG